MTAAFSACYLENVVARIPIGLQSGSKRLVMEALLPPACRVQQFAAHIFLSASEMPEGRLR